MKKQNTTNTGLLILLTISAALGGFLFGFDTAVISGTIPFVKKQYGMQELMEGWYVSSALAGCIVGVALMGPLSKYLGRKKVMLLSGLLFVISVTGCTITPNAFQLIIYRLAGGIGIGLASVVCPVYISEIAPSRIRGKLVTYYQLAITVGILAAYFSNALILKIDIGTGHNGWLDLVFSQERWRGMFAAGILPAWLFMLITFIIPESPRWLLLKHRDSEADKVLNRIGGAEYAGSELAAIRGSLGRAQDVKRTDLLKQPLKRLLVLGILLAALSQFSGINAIIYYGPSLLEKAGFQLGDAMGGQVTIGIVNMVFTFVAIYLIDRAGRKPLLLWGTGGAVVSLLCTAILFATGTNTGWPVLIPVVLFIACFAFSFGPVTWVIVSEIFPTKVRSEAVAISTMSLWLANWVVGQFFPLMLHRTGPALTFLVFALFSGYAFYLALYRIPETKGRTLEEIEQYWSAPR